VASFRHIAINLYLLLIHIFNSVNDQSKPKKCNRKLELDELAKYAKKFIDDEAEMSGDGHSEEGDTNDGEDDTIEWIDDTPQQNDDATFHRLHQLNSSPPMSPFNKLHHWEHDDETCCIQHCETCERHRQEATARNVDRIKKRNEWRKKTFGKPSTAPSTTTNISLNEAHDDIPMPTVNSTPPPSAQELSPLAPHIIDLTDNNEEEQQFFRHDEHPSCSSTTTAPAQPNLGSQPIHGGYFQLRHKKIGLTYPQCKEPKEYCRSFLKTLLSHYEPDLIIVSREDHKQTDGEHLHAYVRLNKELRTTDTKFFDMPNEFGTIPYHYHPNIRTITDELGWEIYITKGGDYCCEPEWFQVQPEQQKKDKAQKKSTTSAVVAEAIKKGTPIDQLRLQFPGFFLFHEKQIQHFADAITESQRSTNLRKCYNKIVSFEGDLHIPNQRIAGWLNDHLLHPHKFRSSNLWIYGATKLGKTSLVEQLIDLGVNCYYVDYATHFYNGVSSATQLLVFDEYKGQRSITEMNKLCDGSRCRLDMKGSTFQITKPIPVMVLSNYSINEVYTQVDQAWLDTLTGRFIEIQVTQHVVVTAKTLRDQ